MSLPPVSGYTVSRWGDTSYDTTQQWENPIPVLDWPHRWHAIIPPSNGSMTVTVESTNASDNPKIIVVKMDGANLVDVTGVVVGSGGSVSVTVSNVSVNDEYYVAVGAYTGGCSVYQIAVPDSPSRVATPTFNSVYPNSNGSLAVSCTTSGATIYYRKTMNAGTSSSIGSPNPWITYTGAVNLGNGARAEVRAIKDGMLNSYVNSGQV